jgi:alpha-beta hydrolase superfamily lysophospholipase
MSTRATAIGNVISSDGTAIAFERAGSGPAVILVAGAFADRSQLSLLAGLLTAQFTVFNYDRRGRGESGDTSPYAVDREIEDLDALIGAAGGAASVFGGSSGAALALEAAAAGLAIEKLALYEPPYVVDDSRTPVPADIATQLRGLVSAGRRGDAAELFMTAGADVPREVVAGMRTAPFWPDTEAVAHTLVYDAMIMGTGNTLPAERVSGIAVPTLVIDGGSSPAWIRNAAQAVADRLPNATRCTLAGQMHDVAQDVLAPLLAQFLASTVNPGGR